MAVTMQRVAHGLGVTVRVVIIFIVITAFCAELGWLVGWVAGEVARIAITHDPTTIGKDFGQAFGQQLQLPGMMDRTVRQRLGSA